MQALVEKGKGAVGKRGVGLELKKPVQEVTARSIQTRCAACSKQELALRKLWVQVQERAHPTDFTWHCQLCGKENHIIID